MPFDFRRFDIYRKVPKDLTQPTYTGAINLLDQGGKERGGGHLTGPSM